MKKKEKTLTKIIKKQQLADEVFLLVIEAPDIARERKAGQFVIVQTDIEWGERIPLTIVDADIKTGTITLIFQTIGASTHILATKKVNDVIAVLGPLGNPMHIENYGNTVCVGGGIGLAPLYPIAQELKKAGNRITVISGARTKNLLILQKEFDDLADERIVVTDDGSVGSKAVVSEPLKKICSSLPPPDIVISIGPPMMMKSCSEVTKPFNIKTMVSLNTIMIDGTGMCGGCRISIGNETKFVCVDGPEFDGHLVNWEELIQRLGAYREFEKCAHEKCHLGKLFRQ